MAPTRGSIFAAHLRRGGTAAVQFIAVVAALWVLGWVVGKTWVIILPVVLALIVCTALWPPVRWLREKGLPPAAVAQLPKSNPAPADKPAPAITGWSTVTTAAAPVPAAVPAPAVASAPTPGPSLTDGRMALAGPTDPSAPAVAAPAPVARPAPAPPRAAQQGGQGSWTRSMLSRRDWFN